MKYSLNIVRTSVNRRRERVREIRKERELRKERKREKERRDEMISKSEGKRQSVKDRKMTMSE